MTQAARDVLALHRFIDSRQNTPHEWGRAANDCVSFVLDAVKAQTGEARASKLDWHDERSGLRVIKREGGLEAAFDRYFQRIPPALAHRGDIAGVPDPGLGIHPMIVEGETLVGPADRGNLRLPRRAMTIAWSAILPAPDTER